MDYELWSASAPYRTLIMVSKQLHCLNDLLFRTSTGDLQIEVPLVVSNHPDAEPLVKSYGIDFHHVPVTPDTKADAEARLLRLVDDLGIDLVVLARYMQILSDDLCRHLSGRAINIHHSFLPSFKGAKPYHQAFDRGVKLVGATAHYVTADLDEGPIIEQDVTRVDHTLDPDQLVAAGRDVEAQVLSRAVRWHAQTRVLLNGNRTVVFRYRHDQVAPAPGHLCEATATSASPERRCDTLHRRLGCAQAATLGPRCAPLSSGRGAARGDRRPCAVGGPGAHHPRAAGPHGEAGVTEIAADLGVHKSTAFRLLATLEAHRLVEQVGDRGATARHRQPAARGCDHGAARPGHRGATGLQAAGRRHRRDRQHHRPLARPARSTWTRSPGPRPCSPHNWVGQHIPLHATSNGKVLLSELADAEVKAAVRELPRVHRPDGHHPRPLARGAGPGPRARLRPRRRRARGRPDRGRRTDPHAHGDSWPR